MKRKALVWLRVWSIRIPYALALLQPVRRRVVLATSNTGVIRGDLAAIRTEIVRSHPSIPIVTLVNPPRRGVRGQLVNVLRAMQAAWYLATSALFVVDGHYLPIYVIKRRPGTTVVQTWHACGAIKKIGYSVVGKSFGADETLVSVVRLHTNYDICLAASQAAVVQYMDAFRQPAELFVTDLGIPRTDVLVAESGRAALADQVRHRYAIPEGRRVILYAPTFRGTSMARAQHPLDLDLGLLAHTLGSDHVLLLRLHPAVRERPQPTPELAGFVIDVSDYPEVNELMLVSDVLVTDYSSVIFEFALLGRPMAFFAPDTAEYDDERGFYFDYRTGVPGPVFETSAGLADWLRAGEFDLERVRAFAARWFDVVDGHASQRFVERVVLPALAGEPVPTRNGTPPV